jgi:hypothetical protein
VPTLRGHDERVFPVAMAVDRTLSREEAQWDAVLLRRIRDGDNRYHDLAAGMSRAERDALDGQLDRFLNERLVAFRFGGRRIIVTALGDQALDRAFRRGWKYGRLVDARELYGTGWRGGRGAGS